MLRKLITSSPEWNDASARKEAVRLPKIRFSRRGNCGTVPTCPGSAARERCTRCDASPFAASALAGSAGFEDARSPTACRSAAREAWRPPSKRRASSKLRSREIPGPPVQFTRTLHSIFIPACLRMQVECFFSAGCGHTRATCGFGEHKSALGLHTAATTLESRRPNLVPCSPFCMSSTAALVRRQLRVHFALDRAAVRAYGRVGCPCRARDDAESVSLVATGEEAPHQRQQLACVAPRLWAPQLTLPAALCLTSTQASWPDLAAISMDCHCKRVIEHARSRCNAWVPI